MSATDNVVCRKCRAKVGGGYTRGRCYELHCGHCDWQAISPTVDSAIHWAIRNGKAERIPITEGESPF